MELSVRRAVRTVQDGVRTQLWPLPMLGVVLAVLLGVLVPLLDGAVDAALPGWLDQVVFNGDPGAARTVLSAVSGSLITVTSLTFSLTVVTLQLASSQFSPRLLRTFAQDLFVQVTLAVFLATFTFALVALRSVRSASEGSQVFVPRLAVTFALLLTLGSVVALVLFLAHLTRQIRVETMLQRVHDDAADTMAANLTRRDDPDRTPTPGQPGDAEVLWARSSGFLTSIDQDALISAARDAGAVVAVDRYPGSFVTRGTPLGHLWAADQTPLDRSARDRLADQAVQAVRIGPERTAAQDVEFGLRQITDIVNKALSPGINDPTTGIHGLGQSGALLVDLTDYNLGPLILTDRDQPRNRSRHNGQSSGGAEEARVVLARPGFGELLELAVAQPRSYGSSDVQVLAALYQLLDDLAWHLRDEQQHRAVRDQLRRLDATTAEQDLDEPEKARLADLSHHVEQALDQPESSHPTARH